VPAEVLRVIAYDIAMNCMDGDTAAFQIERRSETAKTEIATARARITELENDLADCRTEGDWKDSRITELAEALEPFDWSSPHFGKDDNQYVPLTVLVGDLRRARSALSATPRSPDE
jgi:hypothetical protein